MSLNLKWARLSAIHRHFGLMNGRTNRYKIDDRWPRIRYSSAVLPDSDQSSSLIQQQMTKLTERQRETRTKFLEAEKVWDDRVVWESLTEEEVAVVKAHKQAVMNGHFTYDDKKLNKKVMTRLRHFLRGSCCGSACRHCIYDHENVPENLRGTKVFNTAFWTDASQDKKGS